MAARMEEGKRLWMHIAQRSAEVPGAEKLLLVNRRGFSGCCGMLAPGERRWQETKVMAVQKQCLRPPLGLSERDRRPGKAPEDSTALVSGAV